MMQGSKDREQKLVSLPAGLDLKSERGGFSFSAKVTPRASSDSVELTQDGLTVRVKAPPVDGKANEAARRLLAEALGASPAAVSLVSGKTSRRKRFIVYGFDYDKLLEAFHGICKRAKTAIRPDRKD